MERNNQQIISQTFTELDTEFDQHLANMKKYVLELQDKKARQLCALWIKKLCESTGSSLMIRQIRNSFSLKLLHTLQNYESLEAPFNDKPPSGSLRPFNSSSLPEWVDEVDVPNNNNNGGTADHSTYHAKLSNNFVDEDKLSPVHKYRYPLNENINKINSSRNVSPPPSFTTPQIPSYHTKLVNNTPTYNYDDRRHKEMKRSYSYHNLSEYTDDDYDKKIDLNMNSGEYLSSTKPFPSISNEYLDDNNYQYLPHSPSNTNNSSAQLLLAQQKQRLNTVQYEDERKNRQIQNDIDLQFRKVEAKFQEEKLLLQQKHDSAVQKILDRKNTEIEELKSHFRKKSKEYEETIHKLERKTQAYIKDLTNAKEEHEKQILNNKKITEDMLDKKQGEYEKKFAEFMSSCEQDKFDLQKQHTKAFQELVDETNSRLKKVEDEHHEQQKNMDNVVGELEKRIQILKGEIEKNMEIKNQLIDEKNHLQVTVESLVQKLRDVETKNRNLEADIIQMKEFHEQEIKTHRAKADAHVDSLKQEHDVTKLKMSQVKEESEKAKMTLENRIEKLEIILKEKESQLINANEINKQQKIQAEKALAELKRQIELNSNKLYDDMKEQMTKVESDLQRSKSLREKQAKDFQKQFDDIQNDHRNKIESLKNEFENEKLKLKRQCEYEKQLLKKEHSDACNQMQEQFHSQTMEKNEHHRAKTEKLSTTINDLEKQILMLKEELIESNTLRKQQIVELGILREDEKQKIMREHDLQMQRMKMDFDDTQHKCKHYFEQQFEEQEDKANSQIKMLEKDFNERTNKQNGILQDLQKTIQELKDENKRLKEHYEHELHETMVKFEEERNALKKHYNACNWQLEQDLDGLKNRKDSLEKKLKQLKNEHENELTAFKLHYEEKMRGLLPLDMRRDLEDTILALKSQIQSLQQRNLLLQSEFEERHRQSTNSSLTLKSDVPMDYSRGVLSNKWQIKREGEPKSNELWSGDKPSLHQASYNILSQQVPNTKMNNISETIASQHQMIEGMAEFVEKEGKNSMIDQNNKNSVDASLLRTSYRQFEYCPTLPRHKAGHNTHYFETTYNTDYIQADPTIKTQPAKDQPVFDNSWAHRRMISQFSDIDSPKREGINTYHVQTGIYPNQHLKQHLK